MNKNIIAGIVGVVVIVGAAFYVGMVYGKSGSPARGQFSNGQFTGRLDGATGMGVRGGMNGGGFTAGEIISKDESSITIKMQDGSTKIVLVGSSIEITKSAAGSVED